MSLEDVASRTNEFFFLQEFTFCRVTFTPTAGSELELADGIIWLDDLAILFQMKERARSASNTQNALDHWFESKVVKRATRQIRDTLSYLSKQDPIGATNNRGQKVYLSSGNLRTVHKIVLFQEGETSAASTRPKFHRSQSAGVVHLIPIEDYIDLVHTLLTPTELSEYLAWREALCAEWEDEVNLLPEQSLLGHYLMGQADVAPKLSDIQNVLSLRVDLETFDVTGILHKFLDRSTYGLSGTNYHLIIQEIAKLNRTELQTFKDRFARSMTKANANEFTQPYRFASPRTGCGFVFIPLQAEHRENRRTALVNFTAAAKYDLKLSRYIGASFIADEDGWCTVDWCRHESPWEFNQEMETRLAENYPFRKVMETRVDRYTFGE